MRLPKDIKTALAEEALDAFWQVIGRRFPQARTGDLCWDVVLDLQAAAEQAIQQFVEFNVPGYDSEETAPEETTGNTTRV